MCRGTKNAETHLFGPVPAFLSFILYYFVFYTILLKLPTPMWCVEP